MWLVVALEDRAIDLKRLGEVLGAGRLSFGSPDRLRRILGVEPGSVTPFALVNDIGHQVALVLDRGLAEGGPVNAHPLTNTMTTAISGADLQRFFAATGHAPRWLDFPL
jgi:Ala-tRNA(Pro) deacylase